MMLSAPSSKTPAPALPAQRSLPISPRVCLVDLNAARARLGCDAGKVLAGVESGKFLWVFNFNGQGAKVRELRFWVDELTDPEAVEGMQLPEVIDRILPPTRAWFPTGEVCLRFLISRPGWQRIRHQLGRPTGKVSRQPLVDFLQARWTGIETGSKPASPPTN